MQTTIDPTCAAAPAPATRGTTFRVLEFCPKEVIFFQGDREDHVLQLMDGEVILTMSTLNGSEAIVGSLLAGAFLGEEALAGRPCRSVTATAVTRCTVRAMPRAEVWDLLQREHLFREHFVSSLLSRTIRLEHDLADQMLNSAKKRLARALLLLARKTDPNEDTCVLPPLSQDLLAGMVGTTRGRVNRFMNEFRKLGVVTYNRHGIAVNQSMLRQLPGADVSATQ